MILSPKQLRIMYREDFYSFVQKAFAEVEPGTPFQRADYLEALCYNLECAAAGSIKRLVVNMPPRHAKSLVTSVLWPAWMMMNDPSLKIAVLTHSDNLANNLATLIRTCLNSKFFRELAPNACIDSENDRKQDFKTKGGGNVFTTTIESAILGRGFDVIILDDPQSPEDMMSDTERSKAWDIFEKKIMSRLNHSGRRVVVLVQQRLDEGDFSSHMIAQPKTTVLSFPLIATEEKEYIIRNRIWTRKVGDVLCPEYMSIELVEQLREELSPNVFFTQYQQSPESYKGEKVSPDHLSYYDKLPGTANRFYVSVDTAQKTGKNSDYTVMMLIATDGNNHYVVNVIRRRIDVVEMLNIAMDLYARYNFDGFLIENTSTGTALISLLEQRGKSPRPINLDGKTKTQRFDEVQHYFRLGQVFLLSESRWTHDLRHELLRFPYGNYDDQVDALVQYLRHFQTKKPVKPTIYGVSRGGGRFPSYTPPRKGDNELRPRSRPRPPPWRR